VKGESGFTLIEVIAVLILAGVLAAAAGVGIVTGVEGYIFVKETTRLEQTAQLAMERMRRELVQIKTVTAVTESSIKFTIPSKATPSGSRGIGKSGDAVKISVGLTDWESGDTLVGGVNSFTLTFYKEGGLWTISDDDQDLSKIKIELDLDHSIKDVDPLKFTAYVNPRNVGNLLAPVTSDN